MRSRLPNSYLYLEQLTRRLDDVEAVINQLVVKGTEPRASTAREIAKKPP
jgi:hypothetical protein